MSEKVLLNTTHFLLLRKLRKQLGLSVESVSKAINKSSAWVGQVERGRFVSVKRSTLVALLRVLYQNIDISDDYSLLERFWDDAIKETYSSLGGNVAVELVTQLFVCAKDASSLLWEIPSHSKDEAQEMLTQYNEKVVAINAACERLGFPHRLKSLDMSDVPNISCAASYIIPLLNISKDAVVIRTALS